MIPFLTDQDFTLYVGDVCEVLAELPDGSVDCVVTSPPYWGLRDYGTGSWVGGDPGCDHGPERGKYAQGCIECGAPMSQRTAGCRKCEDRHRMRRIRGTPAKDYSPYDPARSDLPNPPAGWAKRDATVTSRNVCGKCGAQRQDQQLGLESTPDLYVANMVAVFREVRRVLADHGTCWVNLGDSYAGTGAVPGQGWDGHGGEVGSRAQWAKGSGLGIGDKRHHPPGNLKPKDLVGIPWKVSQALQAPYYTGRIADEKDRVWLAATLDAEGTICGFRHERKDDGSIRTGVHVTITNSNRALLDNAQRIWPTTRLDHNPHGDGHLGGLPTWRWIAHNVDSTALLMRELYPHLIAKRKQAALAYNLLEMSRVAKRSARTAQADEIRGRRDWIVGALSRLNHAQDVDIPSWCVEPPTLYEPGWYLRSDIIWAKNNPMPESVTDRPTKAHEYVFLLSKRPRYWFDAEAVREPHASGSYDHHQRYANRYGESMKNGGTVERGDKGATVGIRPDSTGRNVRSVWQIATQPYPEAHFATYPEELVRRCLLAGCPERVCRVCGKPRERIVEVDEELAASRRGTDAYQSGGLSAGATWAGSTPGVRKSSTTLGWSDCGHNNYRSGIVLDPFLGSGTTAVVARKHGRHTVGIELNPAYAELAAKRTRQLSLLAEELTAPCTITPSPEALASTVRPAPR